LIDAVASGLDGGKSGPAAARVAAGAILFGYAILGFLEGYIITTFWYQKKLNELE